MTEDQILYNYTSSLICVHGKKKKCSIWKVGTMEPFAISELNLHNQEL